MKKTFLITRPQAQAQPLVSAISQLGHQCITLPCVAIEPLALPSLKKMMHYNALIFTSANAAHADLPYHDIIQPVLSIGPATTQALHAQGLDTIITAQPYSSEGLLALTELTNINDHNIAIFTGDNPKPLLRDTLHARGAHVDVVLCYRRTQPTYTAANLLQIINTPIDAIITTSHDTLVNLITLFKTHLDWLLSQHLLVISEKMSAFAKEQGFTHVSIADSPHTDAICRWVTSSHSQS